MTSEDMERLLNQTIYSWDISSLLSGIIDFLQYSEENLSWQREREVRRAEQEAAELEFQPEDAHFLAQVQDQIIESAKYRFDLGLSQSIRSAGLVAFVTSMEWCARLFTSRLANPLPNKPERTNYAVHVLGHLNQQVSCKLEAEIESLRNAVTVRNCIIHSVGLLKGEKYEAEIRQALAALSGFGLTTENFIGESIHISKGAVEVMALCALDWVPLLDEKCISSGTFKCT